MAFGKVLFCAVSELAGMFVHKGSKKIHVYVIICLNIIIELSALAYSLLCNE